jgi:ribonuclease HI
MCILHKSTKHNELRLHILYTDGAAKGNPGKGGWSSYGERKMGKTYSKEFTKVLG